MIEVKIPAEIHNYKSKLIWGFSTRQVISIGASLAICVPLGVLGKGHISDDILPWLIIGAAAPCIGWGFFTWKDMKFEEFMKAFFAFNFFPQRRVYEDTERNIFHCLNEEILEVDILQQRIENGEVETAEIEIDTDD